MAFPPASPKTIFLLSSFPYTILLISVGCAFVELGRNTIPAIVLLAMVTLESFVNPA